MLFAQLRNLLFGLALAMVIAVTVVAHSVTLQQVDSSASALTKDYTERIASGHADLSSQPDPRLLALPNPYDPTADHEGLRLFDASLYRGRYFLYFGVTPFVTLLAPWFMLTEHHLGEAPAIWFYTVGGFLAYAAILLLIRRRYFPDGARGATLLGVLLIGFAGSTLLLLRRPLIYELVIAAAYFHVAVTLLCSCLAGVSIRRRGFWLGLAGCSLGLAVGSRPNCVLIVPAFLSYAWWLNRAPASGHAPARWPPLIAALAPLALIGIALAVFNIARFGSPFEFGFTYQLVSFDRPSTGLFSWAHVPYNLHRFLFGGVRLGGYFPFIQGELPGPLPLPPTHEETDQLYGFALVIPALWFALAVPWTVRAVPRALSALAAAVALTQLATFLPTGMGAYRYGADITPPLLLVAGIGLMGLSKFVHRASGWRLMAWGGGDRRSRGLLFVRGLCQCRPLRHSRRHPSKIFRPAEPVF